ncbi:MAG TPA: hypothetical protein PKD27_09015 [Tepidiformaceae bacterium]|nr:hypothetical protein [Tepidiformaceae bacterium]
MTEPRPQGVAHILRVQDDLESLYRSWDILDLVGEAVDELPVEWLQILNVARTLTTGQPLAGIDLPGEVQKLLRPWELEYETMRRVEKKRRIVYPVTGDSRVQPLRNVTDFPHITMPDLLMRSSSPDVFDYRLLAGDIHGLYNTDPGPAEEEYDEIHEERVLRGSPNRRKRQKVYALLDVSNSMRDANKILFAKALLLAYLATAHKERAELYFRTFANSVHPRSDVREPEAFPALAKRVLTVTPDGSTDIKAALAAAIGDINALDGVGRGKAAFAESSTELLLISDCESYFVPGVPAGIKLHTIHLKGGPMLKGYTESFEQIRSASATFTELDTTRFVLPETSRDRWLLQQDGRTLEPVGNAAAVEAGRNKEDRLHRRDQLLQAYQRMSSKAKPPRAKRGRSSSFSGANTGAFAHLFRQLAALFRRLLHPFGEGKPKPSAGAVAPRVQFRTRR